MHTQFFSDRVAIVTGAGKGIGQATAIAFSALGASVVICGQSREPVMHTVALIEKSGGKAAMVIGDVSNESVAQETASTALREFGRLDFAREQCGSIAVDRQHRGLHSGVLAASDKRKSNWDMVGYEVSDTGHAEERSRRSDRQHDVRRRSAGI